MLRGLEVHNIPAVQGLCKQILEDHGRTEVRNNGPGEDDYLACRRCGEKLNPFSLRCSAWQLADLIGKALEEEPNEEQGERREE